MPINYDQLGDVGLHQWSGYISEAYNAELYWPGCARLYKRLRRADPEVSVVRGLFGTLSRKAELYFETPEDATPAEVEAAEFGMSVLADMDGGLSSFVETLVTNVPFYGWGSFEILWGQRTPTWHAPVDDGWRSEYADGKIGVRRMAWRDPGSLSMWDISDNGQLLGWYQQLVHGGEVYLPIDRIAHIRFGDMHNPEGLSPLEAIWRMERIKYGLEVIQGIGFEHAAGYLSVKVEESLTPDLSDTIKNAARAIMMAQDGNYAVWPKGSTGEIMDVPFAAAPAILEAIRYWGILKLTVFNAQFVAMSSLSGSGSYSALQDSSSMFLLGYNAMMEGFADQLDAQLAKRLYTYNQFDGRRPKLKVKPIEKAFELDQLAAIMQTLKNVIPLGEEDYKAIRARVGFLPEDAGEIDKPAPPPIPENEEGEDGGEMSMGMLRKYAALLREQK